MANVGDKYIIEITEKGMLGDYYAGTIRLTEREIDKIEKYAPDCEAVYDTGYKEGLEKAWEMAKRIFTPQKAYEEAYTRDELDIIFGEGITSFDLAQMTVFEAVDKVELYEKVKAEMNKIKDGDEVRLNDGKKGVVVYSDTDGHLNVVNAFGGMRSYNAAQVVKTGRHFPQMVEMMKEMRDNDETVRQWADKITSGEYQPVKPAHWSINPDGYYPQCSNCGYEPPRELIRRNGDALIFPRYCPECGCKLDLEGD
jgi:hypothetical protein